MTKFKTFLGVNKGYEGDKMEVQESNMAVNLIKQQTDIEVLPGVVVYNEEWGCPKGGEPIGALSFNKKEEAVSLKDFFKQQTLAVPSLGEGKETLGFKAEIKYDLKDISKKWQEVAKNVFDKKGVYISCGMYSAKDNIYVEAQANPEFVKNLKEWKEISMEILNKLNFNKIKFIETQLTYLK
ncbi:MAG: hypothetical protein ACTSXL_00205 [Alphaproteobacteria bacterium]